MLLEDLDDGSVVGVESARVAVQIETFRDDLQIRRIEGTVDRLLGDLHRETVSGFIVAAEDVEIFGWQNAVSEVFPPDILLPAAGQGSFALLAREDDDATLEIATTIDHRVTRQVIRAERAFLRELNVRITDPVAVHGSFDGETLVLEALLGDEVSGAILRDDLDGNPEEEDELGIRLAKLFVADGARDYLASYK
jgi:hydroxymethylbilane synthase